MNTEKAPTKAQVDALIEEYSAKLQTAVSMKTAATVAQTRVDILKAQLTEMVEKHGRRHTEKTKLLEGERHKAKTTTAVVTNTVPEAVEQLRGYLVKKELVEIDRELFTQHVTYQLVGSPQDVLAKLSLGAQIRTKLKGLIALCFKTVTRSPSLTVDLAETAAKAA